MGLPPENGFNIKDISALSRRILRFANKGAPRIDFLNELSEILLRFSGCEEMEIRATDQKLCYRWCAGYLPVPTQSFEVIPSTMEYDGRIIPCYADDSNMERVCCNTILGNFDPSSPYFTRNGSFWTVDAQKLFQNRDNGLPESLVFQSICMIPFVIDDVNIGLLILKNLKKDYFSKFDIEFYESFAQTLGIAVADRRAQWALRERIKELTCLHQIAKLAQNTDISLDEFLQSTVELLPPAMQYPEITSGRILLDDLSYTTTPFNQTSLKLSAEVFVGIQHRGLVEVYYAENKVDLTGNPFLVEEQSLIDAVAGQIALIIERRQAEDDKTRLQKQLIHADRLATIGQLAAGVAHELNEPLGSILGFSQLVKKSRGLPRQAEQDIEKIEKASLHAREIVKKLLIFARQMPTRKTQVNLNQVIEEGLYFIESRLAKEGIVLEKRLVPNLPSIIADAAQLNQVVVNLVVNALQAMPNGGNLIISTENLYDQVLLSIEDNGQGMSEDIMAQIFIPFFTTKGIGQGTGLGLPVVHGIVTSHGGSIKVNSEPGIGTVFRIILPLSPPADVKESDSDDTTR